MNVYAKVLQFGNALTVFAEIKESKIKTIQQLHESPYSCCLSYISILFCLLWKDVFHHYFCPAIFLKICQMVSFFCGRVSNHPKHSDQQNRIKVKFWEMNPKRDRTQKRGPARIE